MHINPAEEKVHWRSGGGGRKGQPKINMKSRELLENQLLQSSSLRWVIGKLHVSFGKGLWIFKASERGQESSDVPLRCCITSKMDLLMESVEENYVLVTNLLEKLALSRWQLAEVFCKIFPKISQKFLITGSRERIPRIPNCFSDKNEEDISYSSDFSISASFDGEFNWCTPTTAGCSGFSDRHSQPLFIARWTLGEENHKVFGETFNYSLGDGSGLSSTEFPRHNPKLSSEFNEPS